MTTRAVVRVHVYQCSLFTYTHILFQPRSQTLDIKEWQPWKYEDNMSFKCSVFAETMDHFLSSSGYGTETQKDWRDIFDNDCEKQTKSTLKTHK